MTRKLFFIFFLSAISLNAMEEGSPKEETEGRELPKDEQEAFATLREIHNTYHNRFDSASFKDPQFGDVKFDRSQHQYVVHKGDDDAPYRQRILNAAKKGPLSAIEQFSGAGTIEALKAVVKVTKEILVPDEEEIFIKKGETLDLQSKANEWNHKVLDTLKSAINACPQDERESLKAYCAEIEALILAPDYYEVYDKKTLLSTLTTLKAVLQIHVPNISKTGENYKIALERYNANKKSLEKAKEKNDVVNYQKYEADLFKSEEERNRYRELYVDNVREAIKKFHIAATEPIRPESRSNYIFSKGKEVLSEAAYCGGCIALLILYNYMTEK